MHAVGDRGSTYCYIPPVRSFFNFAEKYNGPVESCDGLDRSLADWMAWMYYEEEAGGQLGKAALFGMMTLCSEMDRGQPSARRTLQGWLKVAIQGEGKPIAWPAVFGRAAQLEEMGFPRRRTSAS